MTVSQWPIVSQPWCLCWAIIGSQCHSIAVLLIDARGVRGVDGSCAKRLTVESYTVIYAANSHTYYC